jgi:hypothetical protein
MLQVISNLWWFASARHAHASGVGHQFGFTNGEIRLKASKRSVSEWGSCVQRQGNPRTRAHPMKEQKEDRRRNMGQRRLRLKPRDSLIACPQHCRY